jgi:hypothetical protein
MKLPAATARYDQQDQDALRAALEQPLDDVTSKLAILLDQLTLPFSATPTFDAGRTSVFVMVLTGNVTSSTLANGRPGQPLRFILRQDGTGARTFAWPTIVKGAMVISAGANTTSAQDFCVDGSNGNAYATSPGVVGM